MSFISIFPASSLESIAQPKPIKRPPSLPVNIPPPPNFSGSSTKNGKFHLYGFDSLMQALQWYNNQEELQFLEDNQFRMYKFQIKSKNMIVGKTQSVYFPDINDDMDMLWISSIKLSDLNKSVNINSTTQTINKLFV